MNIVRLEDSCLAVPSAETRIEPHNPRAVDAAGSTEHEPRAGFEAPGATVRCSTIELCPPETGEESNSRWAVLPIFDTGEVSVAFWLDVDLNGPLVRPDLGECWIWTGARMRYGYFQYGKKLIGAHRVAWELRNGPIPDGLYVLHRCDNPPCVRPDHLFLGTAADNTADMVAKGRYRHSTGPHRCGLCREFGHQRVTCAQRQQAKESA